MAIEVPAKKWEQSAVKEIEVTSPMTLASVFTSILLVLTLAIVPSPAPTSKSPSFKSLIVLIPLEKRRLAGPILLKRHRSRLISMMSPVRVPK